MALTMTATSQRTARIRTVPLRLHVIPAARFHALKMAMSVTVPSTATREDAFLVHLLFVVEVSPVVRHLAA
jgi:hypothetical protein